MESLFQIGSMKSLFSFCNVGMILCWVYRARMTLSFKFCSSLNEAKELECILCSMDKIFHLSCMVQILYIILKEGSELGSPNLDNRQYSVNDSNFFCLGDSRMMVVG